MTQVLGRRIEIGCFANGDFRYIPTVMYNIHVFYYFITEQQSNTQQIRMASSVFFRL